MSGLARVLAGLQLVVALAACDAGDGELPDGGGGGGGDGGGGGTTYTECGTLATVVGSAPRLVFAHPEGDTYGVNAFHIWEVSAVADGGGHSFLDGTPVLDRLPRENWQIPTTLWSAIRFGLDGNDPYHFTAEDPFVLGYLPYTPGSSWTSKTGATNDGSCPGSNVQVGELWSCIDRNQLDRDAPALLTAGKVYLLQLGMIIPLGEGQNRVQSCYRGIVVY